jgi:SAM-dependent methyltransferase
VVTGDPAALAEELFALRFELQALADAVMAGTSERWVDGFVPWATTVAHRQRYTYAATMAANRRVLDIACGAGCGSHILASAGAASVLGVDVDPSAIRYARHRYAHPGCVFAVADAEAWRPEGEFDLVVSFETVEHLGRPESLLHSIARALAPTGTALVSTPLAAKDGSRPTNPYHLHEWTEPGFTELLAKAGLVVQRTWYQGVRQAAGVVPRLRRGLRRLGRPRTPASVHQLTGELQDSLAPYRSAGLQPKFQLHLVARTPPRPGD